MIRDQIEEPGRKRALAFTILVHGGLLAALFFGVQWKRTMEDVVEVDLYSSRPTVRVAQAPPPPREVKPEAKPEPPIPESKPTPKVDSKPESPPTQKPDIAIKEEKKPPPPKPEPPKPEPPKPEPPKPEPPKPEPPKPEPPKPKPPTPEPPKPKQPTPEPKVPDFSKELARETARLNSRPNVAGQQLSNAAAAEAEARAAAGKSGGDYAKKIGSKVRGNMVLPPGIQGNPEAIFMVEQLPGGDILNVRLKRSSGNPALDAAIERAIWKSKPLPLPDDPAQFRRDLEIKYKPFEE